MLSPRAAYVLLIAALSAGGSSACVELTPSNQCTIPAKTDNIEPPSAKLSVAEVSQAGLPLNFCWGRHKGTVDGRGWPSPENAMKLKPGQPLTLSFFHKTLPERLHYRVWGLAAATKLPSTVRNQSRWQISPTRHWLQQEISKKESPTINLDLDEGQYLLVVTAVWPSQEFIDYSFLVDVSK